MNRDEVIKANIDVHTVLSATYNKNEPHFYPENQKIVKEILVKLSKNSKRGKLLDIGCGTGFILNLAAGLFKELHGLDATKAMLDKVDIKGQEVKLYEGIAEELPFSNDSFEVVTGYSFLHHVYDIKPVLNEVYRVLKSDGLAYFDLDPNKKFWDEVKKIEKNVQEFDPIVKREIDSVSGTGDRIEQEHGISAETFHKAEYIKDFVGGIDSDEFCAMVRKVGFREVKPEYYWYLGQGSVIHQQSPELANEIDKHLQRCLPVSASCYKYLRFLLIK